ncbi:helix-turn-helix transcriptional regulator [Xanthobacter sp. V4C-4]|uniref:helix-turn-helix domain-containing protein n=1 Tax=Xanthobacter cornucopiae TaxID=3119924 RepID=UPI00372B6BC7
MEETVSGRQIKAARALLGWKRADLATRSGVTAPTVRVIETDEANVPALAPTRAQLTRVLHAAGIVFATGGAVGVQLVQAEEGLAVDELNASNDD